jgi:hypothetical protein
MYFNICMLLGPFVFVLFVLSIMQCSYYQRCKQEAHSDASWVMAAACFPITMPAFLLQPLVLNLDKISSAPSLERGHQPFCL